MEHTTTLTSPLPEISQAGAYPSCWWLHDHLVLGPDGEVGACSYQWSKSPGDVRGAVKLCRITGNRFPAEEIAAARRRIHQEIIAKHHRDCCECPQLVSKTWKARKYLTRELTMNVWTHCNLKCRYCFTVAPGFEYSRVKYPLVEVIADMLANEYLDPDGRVVWGGGDISALPEFNKLAGMFLHYGCYQDFKTSAYKFLRGVADAIAKKRGTVEVSVDAGTRETYASYKGKDVFDRVIENLNRYRENGQIRLKYIAAGCNLGDEDIKGFVRLTETLKPELVMVTPEAGEAWAGQYSAYLIGQIAKLIYLLRETGIPVAPRSHADIARLFPNFAVELERQLELCGSLPHRLKLHLEQFGGWALWYQRNRWRRRR